MFFDVEIHFRCEHLCNYGVYWGSPGRNLISTKGPKFANRRTNSEIQFEPADIQDIFQNHK